MRTLAVVGALVALAFGAPALAASLPPGVQQSGSIPVGNCPKSIAADVIGDSGVGCAGGVLNPTTVKVGAAPSFSGVRVLGDSLTFGYAPVLASQLGLAVQNDGIPGQSPFGIGARDGALYTALTFTGGTECDSGGDTVTTDAYVPLTNPSVQTSGVTGTVAGHHGTLTYNGTTYTFTCDTAGSTAQPNPAQFVVDQLHRNYLTKVVWIGHNVSQQPQNYIWDAVDAILANTPAQTQLIFLSNTYDTGAAGSAAGGQFYVGTQQLNAYIQQRAGAARYVDTVDPLIAAYNSSFAPDVKDHGTYVIPPTSVRLLDLCGVLTSSITSSSTAIAAATGTTGCSGATGTSSVGDLLVILDGANSEAAIVTAQTGSTGGSITYTVTRTWSGTPAAHSSGAQVYLVNTIHYGTSSLASCIAATAAYQTAYPSAPTACGYDIIASTVKAFLLSNRAPAAPAPSLQQASDGSVTATAGTTPSTPQTEIGTLSNPVGGLVAYQFTSPGSAFIGGGTAYFPNLNAGQLCVGTTAAPTSTCWLEAQIIGGSYYLIAGAGANVNLGSASSPFYTAYLAGVDFFNFAITPNTANTGGTSGFAYAKAMSFQSTGTIFSASASAGSIGTLVGGATAGGFSATSTTSPTTVTITMGSGNGYIYAAHGYICIPQDETTPSNVWHQTAHSTNGCTISGPATSGDYITFIGFGY